MSENKVKENIGEYFFFGQGRISYSKYIGKKSQNKLVIDSALTVKAFGKENIIILAPSIVIFSSLPRENNHKCQKN